MPQTNLAENLPFDPGLAHAVVKAQASSWAEFTHCMVDQTFETLGWPLAMGRALVEVRSVGQFLDLHAQFSRQSFHAALDRGRRLSEASLLLTRDIAACMQTGTRQAVEATAQQAEAAAEQLAAEQARSSTMSATKSAEASTPPPGQPDPSQSARTSQGQRPAERRTPQNAPPGAAH